MSDLPVPSIRKLVVVGLGLIGGSLAAAVKKRGICQKVYGVARHSEVAARAVALGLVDQAGASVADFAGELGEGDVIFIAVPTLTVGEILTQIHNCIDPAVTVTDGASVKGSVAQDVLRIWGEMPANVVLGHPIAGSEKSGVEAANPDLYENHRVIITPHQTVGPTHLARVTALWRQVGAEVLQLSVAEHDDILAATSHLPHVIAYSLVDTLAHDSQNQNIFRYAAGGFRDFTRIASSDAVMWRDIMLANRDAILHSIDMFSGNLAVLREAIQTGDAETLTGVFTRAKAARDHFTLMLANPTKDASPNALRVFSGGPLTGKIELAAECSVSLFLVCAASLVAGSDLTLEGVLIDPNLAAALDCLREFGAELRVGEPYRMGGETVVDIRVGSATLKATRFTAEQTAQLHENAQLILMVAALVEGDTVFAGGASRLGPKSESGAVFLAALERFGLGFEIDHEDLRVHGGLTPLSEIDCGGDHQLALAFALAGFTRRTGVSLRNTGALTKACPQFFELCSQAGISLELIRS